jgi:DNA polymerase III subunit epsilon
MSGRFSSYAHKLLKKKPAGKDLHPLIAKHLQSVEKIDDKTPIGEAGYIVFDTELTGLNLRKDSVVSIGAVKMSGGRVDLANIYYRVIAPKTEMTRQSVIIHGITPSEASECPAIEVLLPEFLDFCAGGILVGHFVSIDLAFLNKEMEACFGSSLQYVAADTRSLYRWIRGQEERACAFHSGISDDLDLTSLAVKYGIPVNEAHNALNDAFVTAQLFQRFLAVLPKFKVNKVADLIRVGKPMKWQ